MKMTRPDSALERLLLALEDELLEATDEEILAAAHELGMNPAMQGSAAFFGLTMAVRPTIASRARSWIGKTDEHNTGGPRRRPKGDTPV
jgi:hypothetical protein